MYSSHQYHKDLWEQFAKEDPLYSILSHPEAQGGRWDHHEFFETGEKLIYPEIDELVERYGFEEQSSVLDFGCGVGRLTRCFLRHFQTAVGVDVSQEMIALAKEINPDADHIVFHDKSEPALAFLDTESFDLVYSLITLQHIPRKLIFQFLESLIRVTKVNGMLLLQIPSRELHHINKPLNAGNPSFLKREYRRVMRYLRPRIRSFRKQRGWYKKPYFLMTCVRIDEAVKFFREHGCQILRIRQDFSDSENYESFDYLIRKIR